MTREIERAQLRSVNAARLIAHSDGAVVGQTPHTLVDEVDRARLYRYEPSNRRYPTPILIATSLVSRPYILDLQPGSSLIESLTKAGFEVYLIDWGVPTEADSTLRLQDYVNRYLPRFVDRVRDLNAAPTLTLAGYCLGGLFALWYAATHLRGPIRNLLTIATPIDFAHLGLFSAWTDRRYFNVDRLVDTFGNVPPEILQTGFNLLRPTASVSKYVNLWLNLWNDDYVAGYRAFDKWVNDWIPFPGEAFREMIKTLFWDNALVRGEQRIGRRRVDLGRITRPILNVAATKDHIVPIESTRRLTELVGSADQTLLTIPAGHAGLVAGRSAARDLFPRLTAWLAERSD